MDTFVIYTEKYQKQVIHFGHDAYTDRAEYKERRYIMWQKKDNGPCENLSIEEYLVRRKKSSKERDSDKHGLILPENKKWIFAELYM